MNTRKIKDGKVDGEKIYFKSHAKATYMSDGRTVEEAINSINTGDLSQYATKTELEEYLSLSGGTLTGEIKFNIADLAYKDISAGIIAAFKAPRVQINELISNYIYLGSASQGDSSDSSLVIRKYSSITDKSPSGTTDLVTINTSGNVTAIGGFTGNLTGTASNAAAVNGIKIAIVSLMPSSPDSSTLYFVK